MASDDGGESPCVGVHACAALLSDAIARGDPPAFPSADLSLSWLVLYRASSPVALCSLSLITASGPLCSLVLLCTGKNFWNTFDGGLNHEWGKDDMQHYFLVPTAAYTKALAEEEIDMLIAYPPAFGRQDPEDTNATEYEARYLNMSRVYKSQRYIGLTHQR